MCYLCVLRLCMLNSYFLWKGILLCTNVKTFVVFFGDIINININIIVQMRYAQTNTRMHAYVHGSVGLKIVYCILIGTHICRYLAHSCRTHTLRA